MTHRIWLSRWLIGSLFIGCALCAVGGALRAGETIDPSRATVDPATKIQWFDIRLLGLEGQGWSDTKAAFDRLPAKAEGVVRDPVWQLSQNSAGLAVRFITDGTAFKARWSLTSATLALPHMPATGVSGLDLYVKHESVWRWLGYGRPAAQTNEVDLAAGLPAGTREYLLYLPLYNGVSSVEIGLPEGTTLSKADARRDDRRKPIVFYGTSITQGGCASRPGMVHTAILGRRLDLPVINLGFSGNGKMEPEMAELFAELDPAVYVLDCLPNMVAAEVSERVGPFVQRLRQAHPDTPILLVEDRGYTNAFLVASQRERNDTSRAALRVEYQKLLDSGVTGLSYLEGEKLLGDDNEGTVDSSHPTDLGFVRQADAFERALRPILQQ